MKRDISQNEHELLIKLHECEISEDQIGLLVKAISEGQWGTWNDLRLVAVRYALKFPNIVNANMEKYMEKKEFEAAKDMGFV